MILTGVTRALFWDDDMPSWDGAIAEGLLRLQPGEDYAHERTEIGEVVAQDILRKTMAELDESGFLANRIFRRLPIRAFRFGQDGDAFLICGALRRLVEIGVALAPDFELTFEKPSQVLRREQSMSAAPRVRANVSRTGSDGEARPARTRSEHRA